MHLIYNYDWKQEDSIFWRWSKSGIFSVKSYYNFLSDGGLRCPVQDVIWQNIAPLKVRIHSWLVLNNCLLTSSIMKSRHINIDRRCVFCGIEEDDLDHIFLHCPSLHFFWSFLSRFFNLNSSPACINDWFGNWRRRNIKNFDTILWDSIMMAYQWVIWKERNERIFENSTKNNKFLFNSILFFVDFWTGSLELPLKQKVSAGDLLKAGECFSVDDGSVRLVRDDSLVQTSDVPIEASSGWDHSSMLPFGSTVSPDRIVDGSSSDRVDDRIITYVRRNRSSS